MSVTWIECVAGASGDMFLGAWMDLGLPESVLRDHLAGLSVKEFEITVNRVMKSGIAATKVDVHTGHSHHHRHLPDIERIVDESVLPDVVKRKSKEAFYHLAVAEAKVHGTTPDKIHFHEVGAVDAIVDIVGSMIAWHWLGEPECVVSPIEVGGGTVRCEHGVMPVPAPATALLLEGFPIYSSGVWGETTTPTGAAIVRTLAVPYTKRPFVSRRVGYGAGSKELPVANLLRIQLGDFSGGAARPSAEGAQVASPAHSHTHESAHSHAHTHQHDHAHSHDHEHSHTHDHPHPHEHAHDAATVERLAIHHTSNVPKAVEAVVIEANLDDMTPEIAGYVTERLLESGAMDATWSPIVMKKGRPAMRLQVLCAPHLLQSMQAEIFRQTSSIGLRCYAVDKIELYREMVEVETPFGPIAVKTAKLGDAQVNVAPEYEVCKRVAQMHDVPLKQVYQAALASAMTYK